MTVINNVAVIPIIPRLLRFFVDIPHSRILVLIAVVMPTLGVAFSSVAAAAIGDRIGRRRLLEVGTLLFAALAILPYWLDSLYANLSVRFVLRSRWVRW